MCRARGGGVSARGSPPGRLLPPVDRQTDNITLPQTLFAGGKNAKVTDFQQSFDGFAINQTPCLFVLKWPHALTDRWR